MKTCEEIVIRRIKKRDFEQSFNLIAEGFKREIDIVGLDIRRLKRMAKFYGLAGSLLPILDFLHVDFETILVAVAGNEIVGEIHLVPHRKKIWSLDSAAVSRNFRGRGIYRKLMKEALKYISKRRGERIITSLWADNIAPIKITNELEYKTFAREILLLGELSKTHSVQKNEGILIREMKPDEIEQVYCIYKSFNPRKTDAHKVTPEDFSDSLSKRVKNKIAHINSKRLVVEVEGKIVGYVHVTYTSAKEASNIESFCALVSVDQPMLVHSLLSWMLSFLAVRNIKKVVISLDEERKETVEAFQHFGFKPIASVYQLVKELRSAQE